MKKSFYFLFPRFATLLEKKKAELLKIANAKKIELKKNPTNADLLISILVSESSSVKRENSKFHMIKKKTLLKILKKKKKEIIDCLSQKKKKRSFKSSDKKNKLVGLLVKNKSKKVKKNNKEQPEKDVLEPINEKSDYPSILNKTPDQIKGLIFGYFNELQETDKIMEKRKKQYDIESDLFDVFSECVDRIMSYPEEYLGYDSFESFWEANPEYFSYYGNVDIDYHLRNYIRGKELKMTNDDFYKCIEMINLLPRNIPVDVGDREEMFVRMWYDYEREHFPEYLKYINEYDKEFEY